MQLCTYHLAMSHASYCALHHRVLICAIIFLYVLFGSSRVEPESEQFEQEFEYHPEEDIVGFSTADLTGEPTSFTYFTVSCSLFYCYLYVAILLCHVSYSTCSPIWAVLPLRYLLPVVCCLSSLASRSALLGFVVISICSRCCWVVDTWDTF